MMATTAKYVRLSSEDDDLRQGGKLEPNSIANQRDLLDAFISRMPELAGTNIIEFCAADATKIIEDAGQGKNLKYARKANMNRTIAKLRDRFLLIILEENLVLRQALLERLCCDIAAYPEPIRPGRLSCSKISAL